MKRLILVTILFLGATGFLLAEEPRGVLIFAEGTEFTIVRGGIETSYDLLSEYAEGTEVLPGDFVNTYDQTFIEIQLLPSMSVIRISENTSFRLTTLGASGGGAFEITYGRVRARVEKLVTGSDFTLSGPGIVAGVRGTDFGYDLVADETQADSTPVAEIYCFEGAVEVSVPAFSDKGGKTVPSVVIEANQMVSVSLSEPVEVLVPTAVKPEIREFWEEHPFQGSPIDPLAYRTGERREVRSAGFATLAAGTMMEAIGVVGLFADLPFLDADANRGIDSAFLISGGLLVSGAIYMLIYSLIP